MSTWRACVPVHDEFVRAFTAAGKMHMIICKDPPENFYWGGEGKRVREKPVPSTKQWRASRNNGGKPMIFLGTRIYAEPKSSPTISSAMGVAAAAFFGPRSIYPQNSYEEGGGEHGDQ